MLISQLLRLADFDEVRSGLNTGEAHQRHAPRETSSKTTGSTPHSSFRDRTAMEPAMSPCGIRTGKSWNGLPCVLSGKAQLEQIRSK